LTKLDLGRHLIYTLIGIIRMNTVSMIALQANSSGETGVPL